MSLFSALSRPEAPRDAFAGLPYIQALRQAHVASAPAAQVQPASVAQARPAAASATHHPPPRRPAAATRAQLHTQQAHMQFQPAAATGPVASTGVAASAPPAIPTAPSPVPPAVLRTQARPPPQPQPPPSPPPLQASPPPFAPSRSSVSNRSSVSLSSSTVEQLFSSHPADAAHDGDDQGDDDGEFVLSVMDPTLTAWDDHGTGTGRGARTGEQRLQSLLSHRVSSFPRTAAPSSKRAHTGSQTARSTPKQAPRRSRASGGAAGAGAEEKDGSQSARAHSTRSSLASPLISAAASTPPPVPPPPVRAAAIPSAVAASAVAAPALAPASTVPSFTSMFMAPPARSGGGGGGGGGSGAGRGSAAPALPVPGSDSVAQSLGSLPPPRTLQDELFELENERRRRTKHRADAEAGLAPTTATGCGGDRDDPEHKDDSNISSTRFPRVPGAEPPPSHRSGSIGGTAARLLQRLTRPSHPANSWEHSSVEIDLLTHEQMLHSKLNSYTHQLTRSLQRNLKQFIRAIHHNEQEKLSQTRRAMEGVLAFYRSHEGRMHDTNQALREGERQVRLGEMEEEEMQKQQQLIHEDYQAQHAHLQAQLASLHEAHAAGRSSNAQHHDFLQAHSKTRSHSRRESKVLQVAAASSDQSELSSTATSRVSSRPGSGGLLTGSGAGAGAYASSPLMSAATAAAATFTVDESGSHESDSGSDSGSEAGGRERGESGSDSGSADERGRQRETDNSFAASNEGARSRSYSKEAHADTDSGAGGGGGAGAGALLSDGRSQPHPTHHRGRSTLSSCSSSSSASTSMSVDMIARVQQLRTVWQNEFSAVRRERDQLNQLKTQLIDLEQDLGQRVAAEHARAEGLAAQLAQVQSNRDEQMSLHAAELHKVAQEQERVQDRTDALQREHDALQSQVALCAAQEEQAWTGIQQQLSARTELSLANAAVHLELESKYFSSLRHKLRGVDLAQEALHWVESTLNQALACPSCGYLLQSASLTWETGETTCEKCAFQKLFPHNFQSVVRAMHKLVVAEQQQQQARLPKPPQEEGPPPPPPSQPQAAAAASAAQIDAPVASGTETAPPADTAASLSESPSTAALAAMSRQPSRSTLLDGVSRVHLQAPVRVTGALALDSASLDDLGARLLAEMSTAEHGDSGAGVAVGARIRRGSLGGLVDAFSAMTMHDANNSGSGSPAAGDPDADADEYATHVPTGTGSGSRSASPASHGYGHAPAHAGQLHHASSGRPLGELSAWSSINPVVAASGGPQRQSPGGVPFTLLWLKNRTVDLFVARFVALSSRLHEGAGAARALPPLLATFEAGLSDRHRERMAAVRAEEEAVRAREANKRSANQAAARATKPSATPVADAHAERSTTLTASTRLLASASSRKLLKAQPPKASSSSKKTLRS